MNSKKLNVCLLVPGYADTVENINIMKLYKNFSTLYTSFGYKVSVLYVNLTNNKKSSNVKKVFTKDNSNINFIDFKFDENYRYELLQFFIKNEENFDIIHFPQSLGLGYYIQLYKHQGLGFENILLQVDVFANHLFTKEKNKEFIDKIDDLEIDFFERKSIEYTDFLLVTNIENLDWMKENDYIFPQKIKIIQDFAMKEKQFIDLEYKMYRTNFESKKEFEYTHPKVSVCLIHHNRPLYLEQAIDSLKNQDYDNFEVILVDDGSDNQDAIVYLDSLGEEFSKKGWKIIRQENKYPGAARNNAAKNATGKYLLFMDDDNYAKPNEISTYVKVAQYTNADILTSVMEYFFSDKSPYSGDPDVKRGIESKFYIPQGDNIVVGIFSNCFGDTNALVKRKVFLKIGGFSEDYGIGHEDWEFFGKAILQGFKLEIVPVPLYFYRKFGESISTETNYVSNMNRVVRPYLAHIPKNLSNLLYLSQGIYIRSMELADKDDDYKKEIVKRDQEANLRLVQKDLDYKKELTKRGREIKKILKDKDDKIKKLTSELESIKSNKLYKVYKKVVR
jgi:glycosyltransferase involved in cell wall biosynthesis